MSSPGRLFVVSLSVLLLTGQLFPFLSRSAIAASTSCATPGKDGPLNSTDIVNTYFPPQSNSAISSGDTSIILDSYYTDGANIPISTGDMLMIIQMQDASIDSSNTAAYGSGNVANDGRGITSLNNTGIYEFVRATNDVPLSGGVLNFVGGNAANDGTVNTYVNADATAAQGRRTFQVIRVVQYASLTLTQDITVPDWNGQLGGVLALDIAGNMNFNGFTIDGTERGFRGGFIPGDTASGPNNGIYVTSNTSTEVGGKGEGIAGTPQYVWDGTTAVDLGSEQLPGGDAGRGAPGNAGGGGNAHNAGGGGGANGGQGGFGGIGWEGIGGDFLGSRGLGGVVPVPSPVGDRLIMGGGGGGGDVNNDTNGVRGGQGGGVILIRADQFVGTGTIRTNGSEGEIGEVVGAPDGAGGGGAGGTVALVARAGTLTGLTVEARGGDGGNTVGDNNNEHGPGGGGGGGVIVSTSPGGQVPVGNTDLSGGSSGLADSGNGIPHGATDGDPGIFGTFNPTPVPPIQQGADCYPLLNVVKTEANPGAPGARTAPGTANYSITVTNNGAGGASNVQISDTLPTGFSYSSGAVAVLSGGATGPTAPTNSGSASSPEFGSYLIPENASVTITFSVDIAGGTPVGTYQNPAYVTYSDPSASTAGRTITPTTGASAGENTTYESGSRAGTSVSGTNYVSSSSANEDVVIRLLVPLVRLVKRITAVNRGLINEQTFDTHFVDAGTPNDDDNADHWPGGTESTGSGTVSAYISGITDGSDENVAAHPGDILEYTLPFLSDGETAAQDVRVCDLIPENTTFVFNAYNSSPPASPASGDRGIFISFNSNDVALTNANDGDEIAATMGNDDGVGGYYFPPGVDPSTELGTTVNCGGPNNNGAIVVDLSDLPEATGNGVPLDSHGYIRFNVVVD